MAGAYGYQALRHHLEELNAKPEAVALVDALAVIEGHFERMAAGYPVGGWVNDDFMTTAVGDLSHAIPALGIGFLTEAGESYPDYWAKKK